MDTLLAFFIGLAAGIVYYFFDYKKLTNSYRSWYKLTHKDPLPDDAVQGFVYAQPFSGKLYSAIFLAAVITTIIILTGSANILIQLLYGVFITVGLMVAFYAAPLIFRHAPTNVSKLKKHLEKMDEFEAEMKSKQIEGKPKPVEPPKPEPEPAKKPDADKKDDDWRKGIKDYLND
ncbi:MAG: hypothetical protein H6602_03455 [Flavobacteriales bacterium]|nr:hypothetical protein [Flavobacteriales bacterium]MCB9190702.1 hypothetical protein [Flavobacteriales bacterium]